MMSFTLCPFCGWGSQIKPNCLDSKTALTCDLNLENVRKYCLRHRDEPVPTIVRSVRYQGLEGKGDSYEFLQRFE